MLTPEPPAQADSRSSDGLLNTTATVHVLGLPTYCRLTVCLLPYAIWMPDASSDQPVYVVPDWETRMASKITFP